MPTKTTEWIRSALPGLLIAGAVFTGSAAAGLIVNPTDNAQLLADNIAGTGISVSGINTYTYGAQSAFGTFSNGLASAVGIENGVIISSGDVADAPGPNIFGPSTIHGTPGLPILGQFLQGTPTYDAAMLNFAFNTSTPGNLNVAFSIGSSECCGFRDAYTFLLDGERAFVGNIAPPRTYAGYSATYASYLGGTTLGPNDPRLRFNWISDLITISFGNLDPGRHSLVIAIGDGADNIADSALFVGELALDATIASPPTAFLFSFGLILVLLRRRQRRRVLRERTPQ